MSLRLALTMLFVGVTSVPAQPRGICRSDAGPVVCYHCSLAQFVSMAFGVKEFQLSGPAFLKEQRVDATVDVPSGATPDELQRILRLMLETRMGMVAHRETRHVPAFELNVAEGGPHLNEAGDPFGIMPKADAGVEDLPQLKPAPRISMQVTANEVRIQGTITMAVLARTLTERLNRPVKDGTGLDGKYSLMLFWSTGHEPLEKALRSELGSKLVPVNAPIEMVVVDHIDKHVSKR